MLLLSVEVIFVCFPNLNLVNIIYRIKRRPVLNAELSNYRNSPETHRVLLQSMAKLSPQDFEDFEPFVGSFVTSPCDFFHVYLLSRGCIKGAFDVVLWLSSVPPICLGHFVFI
jgi:hypothetical protein